MMEEGKIKKFGFVQMRAIIRRRSITMDKTGKIA